MDDSSGLRMALNNESSTDVIYQLLRKAILEAETERIKTQSLREENKLLKIQCKQQQELSKHDVKSSTESKQWQHKRLNAGFQVVKRKDSKFSIKNSKLLTGFYDSHAASSKHRKNFAAQSQHHLKCSDEGFVKPIQERNHWETSKFSKKMFKKCQFCATVHIWGADRCPAFWKICGKCLMKNHFTEACRKKQCRSLSKSQSLRTRSIHSLEKSQSTIGSDIESLLQRSKEDNNVGEKKEFQYEVSQERNGSGTDDDIQSGSEMADDEEDKAALEMESSQSSEEEMFDEISEADAEAVRINDLMI